MQSGVVRQRGYSLVSSESPNLSPRQEEYVKDEEEQPEKMIVPHSVLSARNRKRVVFVIVTILLGLIGFRYHPTSWPQRRTTMVMDPYEELPLPTYGAVSKSTDFYERSAMLITSIAEDRSLLKAFLKSIILLLTDHEQVQIRIVLERADYKKYNTEIFSDPAIKAGLPRLDWVFTQDIFPRANSSSPIVKSSHYEEDFYKSMKKAYGCTSLAVDYCWVLDAESFFIRKISFRTMVGEFVRDPHLLVSSMKRVGDLYSIETRKALGMYDMQPNTMEEYFWLYDNSVLPKITAQLVDAVFSGRQPRGEYIWLDVAYYNTILQSRRLDFPLSPFRHWRIIETNDLYGDLAETAFEGSLWDGHYEGIRFFIRDSPEVVGQLAHQILALKWIRVMRCGFGEVGPGVLYLATNLVLCTSEYDEATYKIAMSSPGFGPAMELDGSIIT